MLALLFTYSSILVSFSICKVFQSCLHSFHLSHSLASIFPCCIVVVFSLDLGKIHTFLCWIIISSSSTRIHNFWLVSLFRGWLQCISGMDGGREMRIMKKRRNFFPLSSLSLKIKRFYFIFLLFVWVSK